MSDAQAIAVQLHEVASAIGKLAYAVFIAAIIRGVMNK